MGIESERVSTQEADIAVIRGHRRPPTADEARFGVGQRGRQTVVEARATHPDTTRATRRH
jgi:hypothetical protein